MKNRTIAKYSPFMLYLPSFVTITCAVLLGIFANLGGEEANPMAVRQGDKLIVPPNSPLRKRLVVRPVTEVASPHTMTLPGVVEADPSRIVNILPPLPGRLIELNVDLGDIVKQGQVLAVIHSPELDQAYADIDKARDAMDLASKALNRARSVNEIGGNAIRDLEQITSNYQQALAEFKRAEDRLRILVGNSGDINPRVLTIAAPISGTITALNYGIGSYINDLNATLMTISNLDTVWVAAFVPENLLTYVTKGEEVDVDLSSYPGQTFQGTIIFISTLLEPDSHRSKARIALPLYQYNHRGVRGQARSDLTGLTPDTSYINICTKKA